ncbi:MULTISPECIES: tape measure protein [Rhodococcus]|uniref:tape measure protein n=1 Tax=Rhodococcus TaxID=1827 RepID=UPI001E4BC20F|nr:MULTISPECIES: tape measure protein [Rhodococcus]BDB58992.1 hypothetical protein RDE2_07860 [Rhodococcus sp. RDE2]
MAGQELATAYVSLVVDTKGMSREIDRTLKASGAAADRAGRDMGDRMSNALGRTLKAGAVGAAAAATTAAVAGVGTALTKGWQRLSAIDDAEGKLVALGHSAQSVEKVMASSLASVKGTSYGLGEAAALAGSAVAAGIKPGEELTKYLSLVADTATVAGAPLEDIGLLFNQATTKGKVYTLQLNQLAQRGIPIYQYLAKELDVTQEALSDMVSEGKVDAETYRRAIENNIGGAATAATTVSSQWANTMAAMGRLGASALEPTFGRLTGWLGSGITAIDELTDTVKPLAQALDHKVFEDWGPKLAAAFDELRSSDVGADTVARLTSVLDGLLSTAEALWPPIKQIGSSLMEATAATGVSTWQVLLATLEAVAPILDATLVPALQATASLMENNQGAVTALVLAFAALKGIPALISRINTPFVATSTVVTNTTGAIRGFGQHMQLQTRFAEQAGQRITRMGAAMAVLQTRSAAFARMGDAYRTASTHLTGLSRTQAAAARSAQNLANRSGDAFTRVDALGRAAGLTAASNISRMGAVARGTGAAGLSALSTAASGASRAVGGMVTAMGGPLVVGLMAAAGAFVAVNSEISTTRRHHELLRESAAAAAIGQRDLARAMADSAGAIDDNVLGVVADNVARIRRENSELSKTGPGFLSKAAAGWQELGNSVLGTGKSFAESKRTQESVRREAEKVAAGLDSLTMSDAELARTLTASTGHWMRFSAGIDKTDSSAVAALDALQRDRDAILATKEAAEKATPAAGEMAAAIDTLADKSNSAADRAGALHRILQTLAGVKPDVEEAAAEFGELMDKLAGGSEWDAEAGIGQGLFKDGALDMSVANARMLRDEMDEVIAKLAGLATAGAPLDDFLAESEEQIKRWATNAGLEVDEVRALFESRGFNVDELLLQVKVAGKDQVVQDLQLIENLFRTTDEQNIRVAITDDGTKDWLREAGFQLKAIEGTAYVDIQPKDPASMLLLDEYLEKYRSLDDLTATPGLDLDDDRFLLDVGEAERMIEILGAEKPTPEAELIIDSLRENGEISMKMLKELAAANPETEFWLKIKEAMDNAKLISDTIDEAAKPRTITIDVRYLNQDAGARQTYFGNPDIRGPIPVTGRAQGGPITGGVWGKDSVPILAMPGEHMLTVDDVNRLGGHEGVYRFRAALAAGQVGKYAEGGPIVQSMVRAVQRRFPGMEFTSGLRFTDNGYHSKNQAADFSNTGAGMPSTPEMRSLAAWIADNYAGITLQLIHSPFTRNIGQGQGFVGDGVGFYGAGTMAEHQDHVHWAVSQEVGEPTGSTPMGMEPPSEWTEKDELALESARVAVLQAMEARDKAYANEKKSDADRQQADIKVAQAELKVRELEKKRDGEGGAAMIVTPAPELEGKMDEDSLAVRRAEIAILDAQLARDKVYSDPDSTTIDKEKADLAVFEARNNLDTTIERIEEREEKDKGTGKDGWTTETLRDRVASYGAQVAGIMFDSALEIFGIESRWLDIPWPKYELDSAKDGKSKKKSKEKKPEIIGSRQGDAADGEGAHAHPLAGLLGYDGLQDFAGKLPGTGTPKWIEDLLRKGPKVYDSGGWLNPGDIGINLGRDPEPVFTPAEFENIAQIANLDSLEPAAPTSYDFSIQIVQPTFANESRMIRSATDAQRRQMMRYGGRMV